MNLDAYLDRIGYDGPRDASTATLAAIQRRHAMAIPFENVSVVASGAPSLETGALEDKIVGRRRGGWCFEHNHLLLAALTGIGFDVLPLSARVRYGLPRETIPARSHMVLCVRDGARRMLADGGFGRFTLTAPVDVDSRAPQRTLHEDVRIVEDGDDRMLQIRVDGEWRDGYSFDFVRQHPVDYAQQNWHTATRPGALFANNLVAALPVPGGRVTLFNRTLTRRGPGGDETRSLDSIEALRAALDATFGIRLDDAELRAAWDVAGRGRAPARCSSSRGCRRPPPARRRGNAAATPAARGARPQALRERCGRC